MLVCPLVSTTSTNFVNVLLHSLLSLLSSKSLKGKDCVTLLFISRLQKEKGIYEAIETLKILNADELKYKLIIAGSGTEDQKVNQLAREDNNIELPSNTNKDVDLVIKNESLDMRSYNYASNYAFYKTDNFTRKRIKKAEVFIKNNSTLYDYDVSYNVMAVILNKKKKEIMNDIIAFKNYIHITLIKDE